MSSFVGRAELTVALGWDAQLGIPAGQLPPPLITPTLNRARPQCNLEWLDARQHSLVNCIYCSSLLLTSAALLDLNLITGLKDIEREDMTLTGAFALTVWLLSKTDDPINGT